jgi:hypothetical protein
LHEYSKTKAIISLGTIEIGGDALTWRQNADFACCFEETQTGKRRDRTTADGVFSLTQQLKDKKARVHKQNQNITA